MKYSFSYSIGLWFNMYREDVFFWCLGRLIFHSWRHMPTVVLKSILQLLTGNDQETLENVVLITAHFPHYCYWTLQGNLFQFHHYITFQLQLLNLFTPGFDITITQQGWGFPLRLSEWGISIHWERLKNNENVLAKSIFMMLNVAYWISQQMAMMSILKPISCPQVFLLFLWIQIIFIICFRKWCCYQEQQPVPEFLRLSPLERAFSKFI